jgi:HEAT repeat protein
MVALSLLEKSSVSERLQGVAYSREVAVERDFGIGRAAGDRIGQSASDESGRSAPGGAPDPVVAALFTRLLEDPNVNVRLAALEALRPLAARSDRRGEFVAAVARQRSPLVALSLIDLLLESNDPAARRDLEQLLGNDQLDPAVRGYLRDRLGRSA